MYNQRDAPRDTDADSQTHRTARPNDADSPVTIAPERHVVVDSHLMGTRGLSVERERDGTWIRAPRSAAFRWWSGRVMGDTFRRPLRVTPLP
jgi:hypothetical protein